MIYCQEKKTKRALVAANKIKGKKIADQLEHNKSEALR